MTISIWQRVMQLCVDGQFTKLVATDYLTRFNSSTCLLAPGKPTKQLCFRPQALAIYSSCKDRRLASPTV